MRFLTWIVLISVTRFEMSSEFILMSSCVAPQPCTCGSNAINCENKQLSQVPTFTRQSGRLYSLYVVLYNNQLTVIPAYSFKNLSSIYVSKIYMDLNNNHINNIEMHAFSGIETAVTELYLSNNNLTHLPQALDELSSLNYLYLLGNPVLNLDGSVMVNIGSKLKLFFVSMPRLSRFPDELKYLSGLSSLTLNGINVSIAHSTAFHSFENSLTSLDMSNGIFECFPAAFCRLNVLKSFTSNYSPNLSKCNSSIFDQCSHPMVTVTDVTLQYDQLTVFPKLASVFPNLNRLILNGNLLYFIDSISIAGLTNLNDLYISYNRFTSIPSAINRATNLQFLDVQFNQIDTVEDFDLQRLHNLSAIALNNNPLAYISPYAFTHSPLLKVVSMDNTKLGHIPRALLGLSHMEFVYLNGSTIECSCHTMSYLKTWNVTSIDIRATCSSGISVKSYLMTGLLKCP